MLYILKFVKNFIKLAKGCPRKGLFSSNNFSYYTRIINAIACIFAYLYFLKEAPSRNFSFPPFEYPPFNSFSVVFPNTHPPILDSRLCCITVIFDKKSRKIDHHDRLICWDSVSLYSIFDFKSSSLEFCFDPESSQSGKIITDCKYCCYILIFSFIYMCAYVY